MQLLGFLIEPKEGIFKFIDIFCRKLSIFITFATRY